MHQWSFQMFSFLLINSLLPSTGVLRPQPPEGDHLHTIHSARRAGADCWKDAQTGRRWLDFTHRFYFPDWKVNVVFLHAGNMVAPSGSNAPSMSVTVRFLHSDGQSICSRGTLEWHFLSLSSIKSVMSPKYIVTHNRVPLFQQCVCCASGRCTKVRHRGSRGSAESAGRRRTLWHGNQQHWFHTPMGLGHSSSVLTGEVK